MKSPLLLATLFSAFTAFAQVDTTFVSIGLQKSIERHDEILRTQSNLYKGAEYKEPRQTNDQHPFFQSYDWQPGAITYNGSTYNEIELLYDITSDKVITEYFNGDRIELISAELSDFTINDKKFILIKQDTAVTSPEKGFYQLAYNGETRVIVRWKKSIQERIESGVTEINFEEKVRYFVLHNKKYHRVHSKRSLLKVFSTEKQSLRQFIKKSNISFTDNRLAALVKVASYYDSLKK